MHAQKRLLITKTACIIRGQLKHVLYNLGSLDFISNRESGQVIVE